MPVMIISKIRYSAVTVFSWLGRPGCATDNAVDAHTPPQEQHPAGASQQHQESFLPLGRAPWCGGCNSSSNSIISIIRAADITRRRRRGSRCAVGAVVLVAVPPDAPEFRSSAVFRRPANRQRRKVVRGKSLLSFCVVFRRAVSARCDIGRAILSTSARGPMTSYTWAVRPAGQSPQPAALPRCLLNYA